MTRKNKHDEKVRRIAAGYLGKGYRVEADIPGYDRPKTLKIGNCSVRPDLVVQKPRGKTRQLIEVETPASFSRDIEQRRCLRDYVASTRNTMFRWTRTV